MRTWNIKYLDGSIETVTTKTKAPILEIIYSHRKVYENLKKIASWTEVI